MALDPSRIKKMAPPKDYNGKEMPPPPPDSKYSEDILGPFHQLRVEILSLQEILKKVEKGEASLKMHAPYITKTMVDIKEIEDEFAAIEDIFATGSMRQIKNIIEQMNTYPVLVKPEEEFQAEEQSRQLTALFALFRQMLWEIGYTTIPHTMIEWFKEGKTGYYIPFHDVFKDEMPDYDDRVKLLNLLAVQPKLFEPKKAAVKKAGTEQSGASQLEEKPHNIGGLVDAEKGLIYLYQTDKGNIGRNVFWFILSLLVAAGLVCGIAFVPVTGWLFNSKMTVLLIGWLAVIAGIVIHAAIDLAKRMQSQSNRPPVISIGELPLWVNAKLGQLLFKVLLSVVGLFGFIYATDISNATVTNLFLVGYSLDSFIALFGSALERRSSRQLEDLKTRLNPTETA